MRATALTAILLLLGSCAVTMTETREQASSDLAPQLARYGLDDRQAGCVAGRLAGRLSGDQIDRLETAAAGDADGGTVRDLMRLAATISDSQIGVELARAAGGCAALPDLAVRRVGAAPSAGGQSAARPPLWLNLGNAPTGQAIAVDAASLDAGGSHREAWFRLTNPGASEPTGTAYRLRIDCARRTIRSLAQRRGEDGTARAASEPAAPIEGGTVMEIAFLALCT